MTLAPGTRLGAYEIIALMGVGGQWQVSASGGNGKMTLRPAMIRSPLDFETAYRSAVLKEIAPGLAATFIGIRDLRRLKQLAGRPQDLLDLDKLPSLDTEVADE